MKKKSPGQLIWRISRNSVLFFVFTIAAYFFSALVLSVFPTFPSKSDCQPNHQVFVSTNGVHLDIIIPVKELHSEFERQLSLPPGTEFVSFGWGDKEFYINTPEWSDLTFPIAFQALFLKSETSVHVTLYKTAYSHWRKLDLCTSQLETLNRYIFQTFSKDEKNNLVKFQIPGYGPNDYFYAAKGSFSIFRTCNVWVSRALKSIHVKTSVWSPFDFGVLYHLPENND
jgi:uncharacterized protein (TIGR02117 family)